jgi:hypothetical protein
MLAVLSHKSWLQMHTAYFDDSGTHGSADVVLLAGVFGHQYQWQYFSELWAAKLADPSPGKPPLTRFHMTECQGSHGEFAGWKRTETDFLVHELGRIIVRCGLWAHATAISRKDWDDLITGDFRKYVGDAEGFCIRDIHIRTVNWCHTRGGGSELAFVFDHRPERKKENERFFGLFEAFQNEHKGTPKLTSLTFEGSQKVLPLQAADLIAWEIYRHALDVLNKEVELSLPRREQLAALLKEGRLAFAIADRRAVELIAGKGARFDPEVLKRAVGYIESTTPWSMLLKQTR